MIRAAKRGKDAAENHHPVLRGSPILQKPDPSLRPAPANLRRTEEARNFVRDDIRVSFSADGEAEVPPFRIVIFRRLLEMFLDVLGGVSTAGKAGDAAPGAGFPVVRDVACENPRRQFDVQVARESV